MKGGKTRPQLYLNTDEARAVMLALERIHDETKEALENQSANFTPDSRMWLREIAQYSTQARMKISKVTGIESTGGLPDVTLEEYRAAFTKES